jgi:SAM-dependent methyltransferase
VSVRYRLAYGIGFTPWEQEAPKMAPQITTLLQREEADRHRPYGRALDLGSGTGVWSVEPARRSWQVVAVELIPKAVRAAQRRAQQAGVDVRVVHGDVTALRDSDVGADFRLLLDIECFNHLNDTQRSAMRQSINTIAAPDATLLMLVWARARRGPFPPGANPDDLTAALPGWQITAEEPYQAELPRALRRLDPRWYRLTRT